MRKFKNKYHIIKVELGPEKPSLQIRESGPLFLAEIVFSLVIGESKIVSFTFTPEYFKHDFKIFLEQKNIQFKEYHEGLACLLETQQQLISVLSYIQTWTMELSIQIDSKGLEGFVKPKRVRSWLYSPCVYSWYAKNIVSYYAVCALREIPVFSIEIMSEHLNIFQFFESLEKIAKTLNLYASASLIRSLEFNALNK